MKARLLKKKSNQKGFTLIEIIVVLVILAILAAATIPAMIGFVDDARGKAFIAEARVGMMAAQAVVTEVVAGGGQARMNDGVGETKPLASGADTTYTDITANPKFRQMVVDVTNARDVNAAASAYPFSKVVVDTANGLNRVTGITFDSNPSSATDGFMIQISATGSTVTKKK